MDPPAPTGSSRWLVRFGYDGPGFAGWARQPGLRTVEEEIRRGLVSRGIAASTEAARLEVGSRTDRGVGARANALGLSSALSGETLLRRLNGISRSIWFTAAVTVPDGFRVRRATRRIYRYFDPAPLSRPELVARAARILTGGVDARSFGKGVPSGTARPVPVEEVSLSELGGGHVIEVRAPSFVWGMVRKIVGALREVGAGRLTLSRLESAARGKERLTLPLAEAEGLVLWEVEYPVRWETHWPGPNRHQRAYREAIRQQLWGRQAVVERLFNDRPLPGELWGPTL